MIENQSPDRVRCHLVGWVLSVTLLAIFSSTLAVADALGTTNQTVVHVVLVWLKEPGNADHAEQIIRASHSLRGIPGVR